MSIPQPGTMREIPHDAMTMAAPMGITSYVVPTAGEEGGQPGWHSKQRAARVVVDPHLEGQRIVINPSAITKQAAAAAAAQANVREAGTDLDTRRDRIFGAAVMLSGQPMPVPPVHVQVAQQVPPPPLGVPIGQPTTPAAFVHQDLTADASAYASPAQKPFQPQTQPAQVPVYGVPNMLPAVPMSLFAKQPMPQKQTSFSQPEAAVKPPSVGISFEVEGYPQPLNSFFHDVIISGPTLVLVFDKRAVGFPCNFPRNIDEQRVAVQLASGPIYYCAAPKHQFEFMHYELCLLEIVQAG
jgi:hypothetical protein